MHPRRRSTRSTYSVTEPAEAGFYLDTIGFCLDTIVCDDADSFGDLGTQTAVFSVPAEAVTCTFTNAAEDGGPGYYDDDPGEFDFDTPFGDGDGDGDGQSDPQPVIDVAGGNTIADSHTPPSSNQLTAAGGTDSRQPAASPAGADPTSLGELPRTGAALDHLTLMAGLLLISGGMATLGASRRRRVHQV